MSSTAPSRHVDLLNMCKCVAEKLEVPWQSSLFTREIFSAEEQDADTWEEMAVIADLSLHIQCVSFQATSQVMVTLVIQK